MRKKLLVGLGFLVVVLFGIILSQPDTFRIERTVAIAAPPPLVFAMINDFHSWASWSPYEGLDPNLKKTYTGAAAGPGAVYSWVGNDKAGEGRMTIVDSRPPERVTI